MKDNSLLLKTVSLVGKAIGVEIEGIKGKDYGNPRISIFDLAKDSHVRIRMVTLKENWWTENAGSFVGYRLEEGSTLEKLNYHEVALIEEKCGQYVMVDFTDNSETSVTKEVAMEIMPKAYMFFRRFKNDPLKIKDVFYFALFAVKSDLMVYVLLGFICSLIGLIVPEFTRNLVDELIPGAMSNMIIQTGMLVIVCSVATTLMSTIKSIAMIRINMKMEFTLQSAIVDRMLRLPVAFFRRWTSGDLANRIMSITQLNSIISNTVINSGMSFIFSIVYLGRLFHYNSKFTSTGILMSLIPIILSSVINYIQYKWDTKLTELNGKLEGIKLQFVMGVQKIFLTSSSSKAIKIWQKPYYDYKKLVYKSQMAGSIYQIVSTIFPIITTLVFYRYFVKMINNPDSSLTVTMGTFMAFLAAYNMFLNSLLETFGTMLQIISSVPLIKRITPIIQEMPEIIEDKAAVTSLSGNIEIKNLSFKYQSDLPLVLDDVSIDIPKGKFTAVVGHSGSGKSTLIRLLLGFETPLQGSIYYDSVDISSLEVTSLRRCIGSVLQNETIRSGSIYQNIAGSSNYTKEEVMEAVRKSCLDKDIEELPMGLHTLLPAGGSTLSGGQRQRLMIAQALVKNPSVLFFDEATSALDNKTQAQVMQSLEELKVTRLVIAHRLSTIIHADYIYVLDKGKIVEEGTYNNLMKKNGFFAELAKRQSIEN